QPPRPLGEVQTGSFALRASRESSNLFDMSICVLRDDVRTGLLPLHAFADRRSSARVTRQLEGATFCARLKGTARLGLQRLGAAPLNVVVVPVRKEFGPIWNRVRSPRSVS